MICKGTFSFKTYCILVSQLRRFLCPLSPVLPFPTKTSWGAAAGLFPFPAAAQPRAGKGGGCCFGDPWSSLSYDFHKPWGLQMPHRGCREAPLPIWQRKMENKLFFNPKRATWVLPTLSDFWRNSVNFGESIHSKYFLCFFFFLFLINNTCNLVLVAFCSYLKAWVCL